MLTIRPFRADEAEALGALRLEGLIDLPMAFAEHADSPPEDFSAALAAGAVWGAFDEEGCVAMAGLRRWTGANVAHRATIVAVYVRPRARGQKAGRRLLEAMIDHGANDGIEIFELAVGDFNAPALALYRSLGFAPIGYHRRAVKIGEDYTDEIHMALYRGG